MRPEPVALVRSKGSHIRLFLGIGGARTGKNMPDITALLVASGPNSLFDLVTPGSGTSQAEKQE